MQVGKRNFVADLGFMLSAIGIFGLLLFFVSSLGEWVVPLASVLSLLCLPGLVLSLLVLCFAAHKGRAALGVFLGLLGSLYAPTILFSMVRAFHENF